MHHTKSAKEKLDRHPTPHQRQATQNGKIIYSQCASPTGPDTQSERAHRHSRISFKVCKTVTGESERPVLDQRIAPEAKGSRSSPVPKSPYIGTIGVWLRGVTNRGSKGLQGLATTFGGFAFSHAKHAVQPASTTTGSDSSFRVQSPRNCRHDCDTSSASPSKTLVKKEKSEDLLDDPSTDSISMISPAVPEVDSRKNHHPESAFLPRASTEITNTNRTSASE